MLPGSFDLFEEVISAPGPLTGRWMLTLGEDGLLPGQVPDDFLLDLADDGFLPDYTGDLPQVLPGEADLDGPAADRLSVWEPMTGGFALTIGEDGPWVPGEGGGRLHDHGGWLF